MRPALPTLFLLALLPLVAGCDQLTSALDLPNPKRTEAEGRAIGSACRHAGRSLEDCFTLNPGAEKAAVFSGWREMNDYMMARTHGFVDQRNPPTLPQQPSATLAPRPAAGH